MPRIHSFPPLYDEAHTVTTTKLKEWGYLVPGQWKSGVITWSCNGYKTGSISISVNTKPANPYLELSYKHGETPINYRVQLITMPSNLGKGQVWYFICPSTGRRCRKLYSIGEKFLHRTAYLGCMYEAQTYSQKTRAMYKMYERTFGREKYFEQLYSKYFKRTYKGMPTKRFLRILTRVGPV